MAKSANETDLGNECMHLGTLGPNLELYQWPNCYLESYVLCKWHDDVSKFLNSRHFSRRTLIIIIRCVKLRDSFFFLIYYKCFSFGMCYEYKRKKIIGNEENKRSLIVRKKK